ncbi:helix-turn-helix domain-containing protein [Tumebacillus flagellatus]|uniref:HTH cro/C1-type domain-containing protein n=1 Tax=Tumebacillus flagellatus TaxID=1157490 RepID=A0A074M587_9BACL|nr:helix-turn-helix transcriptional regulator [Tumebacillus flagellatus]KEO81127.1 hypothetical protein EL26_22320 [Tumebacillus flagellatus]
MEINGKKVRKLRKQRGWIQKELAEGICTASMISQIETGKARTSAYVIQRIAAKLGVSEDEFKK